MTPPRQPVRASLDRVKRAIAPAGTRLLDALRVKPSAADRDAQRRAAIVADALALHRIRARVHYSMTAARMETVRRRIRAPWSTVPSLTEDCSSCVTGLYWRAGAPDPNGLGYNGTGYTGTLLGHGRAVTRAEARPADLVFYGRSRAQVTHVAMILETGDRIAVFSHGSEPGPFLLPIDYRADLVEIRTYPLGA